LEDALSLLLAERDENICRKDFTPSEAVAVGQRLAELERLAAKQRQACAGPAHGPGKKASASGKFPEALQGQVRDKVGQAVGMSGRTFERAKAVVEAAAHNPEKYGRLMEKMDRTGKVNGVCNQLQRQQRAAAIAAEPPPLPHGPFRVVVADPTWQYGRADDPTHQGTCPYPTMPLEAIQKLPVGPLACDDSILWLWTTNAHLRQAFDVAAAWGFETKTVLTWVKDRFGTGNWLRGQTEHCLLAVRGRLTVTLTNHSTVLEARCVTIRGNRKNSISWWKRCAPAQRWSCSRGRRDRVGVSTVPRSTAIPGHGRSRRNGKRRGGAGIPLLASGYATCPACAGIGRAACGADILF
jgi:hypothetical protein